MYEFLKDFDKRMEKLSYPFLIDSQVVMKTEWEKYGLKLQQTINLVYSVMCLIMDKSLKEEECTYKDINSFLADILSGHYNINLPDTQIYELAQYIIKRVLRNEGEMFTFETTDYSNGITKPYQYHLVRLGYSKDDPTKSAFRLTDEGYRLMLNSFEVDQKLQIEIESFVAEESIKRNNYGQALRSITNLNNLITSQIQSIDNFILRARENVLDIDQSEFNSFYKKNIDILNEQNEKFINMKKSISTEKAKVLILIESNLDKEHHDKFKQLADIEKELQRIIEKATALIGKHIDFSEEYIKALDNLSYYHSVAKIDFKDKILFPIERDITKLKNIDILLNYLFKPKTKKRFNINKIFEEQRVYIKDEDTEVTPIDSIEDDDNSEEMELKQANECYSNIIISILTFIYEHKQTELKCLLKEYENKKYDEYIKLVPSIRYFSDVLIELIRIGEINIQDLLATYSKSYVVEDATKFDIGRILFESITNNAELKNMTTIKIYKKDDGEILEIREHVPKRDEKLLEEMTIIIAKCNNFTLEIE